MASSSLLVLFITITITLASVLQAQVVADGSLHLMSDTMDWPSVSSSHPFGAEDDNADVFDDEATEHGRRSLLWHSVGHRQYYISYGALSANRIPCPPRSGRSYYTNNCYHARGHANPYTRGCSAITRCRH